MGYHVSGTEIVQAEAELTQAIAIVQAVPKKDDFDRGKVAGLERGEAAMRLIYRRPMERTPTGGTLRFAREDVEQAIRQVLPPPVALPGCDRTYDRGVEAGLIQASTILRRILERARMRWVRGQR